MTLKPMRHQTTSVKFGERAERMFDASDPGTGKTAVQVWLFAKRRKRGGGCALVFAPKSLLEPAWQDDFAKFAPHLKVSVAYASNREKAFAADADVYITNTDAVKWVVNQKAPFFKKFDTLIIDEVSAFKHHTSGRSKAMNKIKKHFRYRAVLSGTPNTNTILDMWHPMLILDDGKRLGQSFFAFRNVVCSPEQVGPRPEMVSWVDKDGAEEVVYGMVSDITVRHRFEDCIDIPPTHMYTRTYRLPDKQIKAYREMEATQILSLIAEEDRPAAVKARLQGESLTQFMSNVTAINAAAVRTKLLQIASGAVYETESKYHVVDTGRYEMVMDLVEERNRPLVFYLWRHQRDQMVALAKTRGIRYAVIDGSISDRVRTEIVTAYQQGFYDVLFVHPMSAAHGLTLTAGSTTIWPSPTDNLEWFAQGNKRQARQGQKNKTEIIVLLAEGTIESRVYERLNTKKARMGTLLDLFAEAA